MHTDSDSRYHHDPEDSKQIQGPTWIELNRTMFGEGTLGFNLFPEILEERSRPETIFTKSIDSFKKLPSNIRRELQKQGLVTIFDVLNAPESKISTVKKTAEIKRVLKEYLEGLALTPHAKLLHKIFGEEQYPVPPDKEVELIKGVEEQLLTLSSQGQRVLRLRFGLDNGLSRTLDDIGPEFKFTRERIRQIEAKAFRRLRYQKKLEQYLSLPENCLGKQVFNPGAILIKDLPKLEGDLEDLVLSNSTWQELKEGQETLHE